MATRLAKGKQLYSQLNKGKLNIYKLFVERAHQLVKPAGMVGLLTPSGIASDLSSSGFFRKIATGGHLKALYDFENEESVLPRRPCQLQILCNSVQSQRKFGAAQCGFYLHLVENRTNPDQAFPIAAEDFARVNPNTGTAPIFRTRRDMELTTAVYGQVPVLFDKSEGEPMGAWPVKYSQMINMTSDSHLFRTREELEDDEGAWPTSGNRWNSAAGEWIPLYEGKMVQAFNHRAASVVVNPKNVNRPAQPRAATLEQSSDPKWLADPQFWIQPEEGLARSSYALCFKDVTAPTNARTMIATAVPTGAVGNTLPLIDLPHDYGTRKAERLALLSGNLNASAFDYVARQKVQGQHLTGT